MKGLFLSMTLLLCPPPYGNAEASAATASQEASDPRFRAELDTLGGLRAGVEYTLRYECTAPCDSIRPPCFREPIETVGEATHYRGTRLEFIDGRRRKYTTQGLSLRIRFTREGVAEVSSATTRIGGRKYATQAVRVRVGPPRQDLRDIRCRFELRPEHPQAGSEFTVALVCTARPDNGDPGIAADGLTFRRSGSGVQTGTDAPRYEYTFRVRAEREGRYTIRTAGLRFGGREYALSRELRIGRTGADAPDPDSPESRDARPATGRASDPEHPFFLLFGGLLTLMAAEWLAVRQFVRHECDEPLADFVLRTGRLPLTAWQASTHYGLPLVLVLLPAVILAIAGFTDGFSRATFAAFPWKRCAALPLALAVITARRQYRKLRCTPVRTPLKAGDFGPLLEELCRLHGWEPLHYGTDCFVGRTHPGFPIPSWGERLYVVFGKGEVQINSISDPDERTAISSFGRNRRNIRLIREAVERARKA